MLDMSGSTKNSTANTTKMNSNIYRNVRKAIVIRSHQVDSGAGAIVGLASNFSEKTRALKVRVRMSHIHEAALTFGGS